MAGGEFAYMTPIIFLRWIDAHSNAGWYSDKAAREWGEGDWYCEDVGFLIKETEKHITFAQRHEPNGRANGEEQWGGLHKIPKTWVKGRRVLGYMKADGTFVAKGKR